MSNIRKLQEQYLATGDDRYLGQLYQGLCRIGVTIQKKDDKVSQDYDDSYDVAGNVCIRLMTKREPIINCAPSAYMKMALFYKNKENLHDNIEDYELPYEAEDSRLYEEEVDKCIEAIKLDTGTEAGALAEATLRTATDWIEIRRKLRDADLRKDYTAIMKEIYEHEKGNLQSNRMLSDD